VCGGGARSGKQKRKRGRLQQRLLQQLLWRLTPQPLLVSSSLNRLNSTTKGMDANLKLSGPTNLCIQGRSCCSLMCCVETDRQAGRQADRPTDRRQINRQTNLQTDSLTRSRRERTSDSCPPDKQVHGISLDILCLQPKASVSIQRNLEGHRGCMKPSVWISPVLLEDALVCSSPAFGICKSVCRQGNAKGKLGGDSKRGGSGCEAFCSH